MADAIRYLAIGVAVCLAVSPVAYCEIQRQKDEAQIIQACMKANGEYGGEWGRPYCKLPERSPQTKEE